MADNFFASAVFFIHLKPRTVKMPKQWDAALLRTKIAEVSDKTTCRFSMAHVC